MSGSAARRWRDASPLLDVVLELDDADRASFLARACEGDPELRRDVEALLRATASEGDFLERSALRLLRVDPDRGGT